MAGQLNQLISDLGEIPDDFRRELRPALREGARPTLTDAQRRASWSTRIPGATRITTGLSSRGAGVSIVVSADRAPHARPYENLGQSGTFRHPVFGHRDRSWVEQTARPYLWPAFQANQSAVEQALADAVDAVALRHGWSR